MSKQDVIAFFDRCAPGWDKDLVRNETVISRILDNGGIRAGVDVLDVACGTGVLIPDYLARGAASVTAIDISPEMIRCAQAKFPQEQVQLICGDVETAQFARQFDCCMVYNAFPHFPRPEVLLEKLASVLKPGGRLSVAHGMSRAKIDSHHSGAASGVSVGLMPETELAELMRRWFTVDVVISDDTMYQVSGVKK